MKKITWILCIMIIFSCVAMAGAAAYEISFGSDIAEVNVGRRLDIGGFLNALPEENITEITYIVADKSVGEIIDGKFVTKRVGNTAVTAVGSFDIDGQTLTDYDALTVVVNKEGSAVKSYDTNMDGIIDGKDLEMVLSVYGSNDVFCDFNEDGVVNSSDLSLILSMYDQSL
ncbi:MAG: hypothetical protein E7218_00220 [Anaerofustis stercorihominis]|nr:hypothetical protein [Anaerofustis stercorihominis]